MAIQDKNWLYSFLRHYVDYAFKISYRRVQYIGRKNIPTNGSIIFAPNHSNALMDALAILIIGRRPTVFVARADIFKSPTNAKILNFLKIMPISRIRDGRDQLLKNDETAEKSVDVLCDGVPFCIMPEGKMQCKHSLLNFGKGIFRIALAANEKLYAENKKLYIVPVGIDYGDYLRFRSTLLVNIGKPLNVTDFVAKHPDKDKPEMMNALRDELWHKLHDVVFYIPVDENYEGTLELCYLNNQAECKSMHLNGHNLYHQFKANNYIAQKIQEWLVKFPEQTIELIKKADQFRKYRLLKNIADETVTYSASYWNIIWRMVAMIVTLPYFLASVIFSLPLFAVIGFFNYKIHDKEFANSVRMVIALVGIPLLTIVLAFILPHFMPWIGAVVCLVAAIPAFTFTHTYARWFRMIKSNWIFLCDAQIKEFLKDIDSLQSHLK